MTAIDLVRDDAGIALWPRSANGIDSVALSTLTAAEIARTFGPLSRFGQADTPASVTLN
ncbi:hypothetical protein SAMN04488045_2086 [Thalassococcus halodurans]|uniref:Uncharacterized protein n=1 Tax=Thalassococcus halodurans TaxID=373675 RepID=A0A1H5YHJ2_9RHOB|nr:hypothetical protein SAMN04488045_2086 [Thalassococcus halodurans]